MGSGAHRGLIPRGNVPSERCQGKLAKRCLSSSVELERGGSSVPFIPTQPRQGNSNEFAVIYKTKPLSAFQEERAAVA